MNKKNITPEISWVIFFLKKIITKINCQECLDIGVLILQVKKKQYSLNKL